jgi:predicted kinase
MAKEIGGWSEMKLNVIMTKGLPASGKSTWATLHVLHNPGWKRINRDDLRMMIDASLWTPENEKDIIAVRDTLIKKFLRMGRNVIIDDTNLRASNFTDVANVIESTGLAVELTEKAFPIDVQEAIARDYERKTGHVGSDVIVRMWEKFKSNKDLMVERTKTFASRSFVRPFVPIAQNPNHPRAIICDLDGTLALIGNRSPYDASVCDEVDTLNQPVADAVRIFSKSGYLVLFVSGRNELYRDPTNRFLLKHLPDVYGSQLFMRKNDDMRRDTIIKREIWDTHIAGNYNVLLAIDDRPSVVRMWRYEIGIPVFAVNDVEF